MALSELDKRYFRLAVGTDRIGREQAADIPARCPLCGDSERRNVRRLHLYNKGTVTNVNCFNGGCAVENKTMYSFLRDFYPALFTGYKQASFRENLLSIGINFGTGERNIGGDVFANFGTDSTPGSSPADAFSAGAMTNVFNSLDQLFAADADSSPAPVSGGDGAFDWLRGDVAPMETAAVEPERVKTTDLSGFMVPLSESSAGMEYLSGRGITYNREKFGDWYYGDRPLTIDGTTYGITGSIVVPLYYRGVMYGFYSRSTTDKSFTTFMSDVNIGYKIFNFFNVDLTAPVYIYEGVFDAVAGGLTNSVALLGAKIPEERLSEMKHPVFVLDNDATGLKNAVRYAVSGHRVFVQPREYHEKDMNELAQNRPALDIPTMIKNNIFSGVSAEIRLNAKLS